MSAPNDELKILDQHPSGESKTGFEKRGDRGPFECWNCEYYDPKEESCGQEVMIAASKQPLLPSGRRSVDRLDCCAFIERIGKKG